MSAAVGQLRSLRGRRLLVLVLVAVVAAAAAVAVFASTGGAAGAAPARSALSLGEFNGMFSFPREPETLITPGQFYELAVPEGKRVVITDIYIENLGGGTSTARILEQRSKSSFEVRYTYRTHSGETTIVDYTTGLKLGDEVPIQGTIRLENPVGSQASIIARANGFFVP
jgi:hypothetical protein